MVDKNLDEVVSQEVRRLHKKHALLVEFYNSKKFSSIVECFHHTNIELSDECISYRYDELKTQHSWIGQFTKEDWSTFFNVLCHPSIVSDKIENIKRCYEDEDLTTYQISGLYVSLWNCLTTTITVKRHWPEEIPKQITEEYFLKYTGREPIEDDLERCNCDKVGSVGHASCGWNRKRNLKFYGTELKL